MTDAGAILGIDLGTSSVKVAAVARGGEVLARPSGSDPRRWRTPTQAEPDTDDWWAAVRQAVREVGRVTDRAPLAIGLSGQLHGLVLSDADGEALRPAIVWADSR